MKSRTTDTGFIRQARALAAAAGVEPDPRTVIQPWRFADIVRNCGFVVVVHGDDDDVIDKAEAEKIAAGLRAAEEEQGGAGKVKLRLVAGIAHGMEKSCPVILGEICTALVGAGVVLSSQGLDQ